MTNKLIQNIPTPIELRTKLEEMVRADLLGPAGGPKDFLNI